MYPNLAFPFQYDTELTGLDPPHPTTLSPPRRVHSIQRTRTTAIAQHHGQLTPASYKHKPAKIVKRGVNSWMAFRSFYSKMFTRMQQKNTSGLLKMMWDQDPFKAKWSIIARAYTNIRDQVGKANASIEIFFSIVCPRMGIIGVDDYFARMEWVAETREDGSVILNRNFVPDLAAFPSEIMSSNLTEKDVVHFCALHKYLSPSDAIAITGSNATLGGLAITQASQQGLLAPSPALQSTASSNSDIPQPVIDDTVAGASPALDFDADRFLGENFHFPVDQSDYYTLEEGQYGLDDFQSQPNGSQWDFFNIYDPNALDGVLDDAGRTE